MQSTPYESVVSECNITKVVLFKSGLAYYEREASVPAGESCINLTFNEDEVHQVVSTLIVDDPEGGVKSVTFGKPKDFGQRRLIGQENKGFENLLLELRGTRIKCTFENKQNAEGLCLGTEKKWQNTSEGKSIETSWISIFDTASNSLKHVEMRWVTDIDILDRNVAQELQDALRNELSYRTEDWDVKTRDVAIHLEGTEPRKVKISCVHTVGPWYIEYRLTTNPVRLDTWVVLQHPRHSFHNAALWAVSENLNVSIGPDPTALAEHCLKSAQPVTVVKNSPALIPLSRFNVDAKIICLYDPKQDNARVSLAVLLKNKSKLPTEKGNVTIFQNGLYLGSSVINVCRPGEDQFLKFGNADFMKLDVSTWNKVTFPTKLRVANRNLSVSRRRTNFVNFNLNGLMLEKPMDLYVLYPLDWLELISKDDLIQIKDSIAIFKSVLEPTKKPVGMTALKLETRNFEHTNFALRDLTRAQANKWYSHKLINQQVYDSLEELISLNERMEAHAKLMDQKIKEMDDTLEDGKRIIGNIGLVSEQLKEDSELRNKWMTQLLTYEEKYQEGRVQMREMLQQAADYELTVEEFLRNLVVEVDLGDQIEEDPNASQFSTHNFVFGGILQPAGVFSKHKNYAQNMSENFGAALQKANNNSGFGSSSTGFGFGAPQTASQGATFAFGSTSAGGFTFGGSSSTSGTTSSFGGSSTTGGFGFGSSRPASGSTSGFGSTSGSSTSNPFGTSTFGGSSSQPSLFGSTSASTTGGFGTTSASQPPTSGFGRGFGSSAEEGDFKPTAITENNQTLQFQHISAMPKYAGLSPEEIRLKQQEELKKQQQQLNNGGIFGSAPAQSQQQSQPQSGFSFGSSAPQQSQPQAFTFGSAPQQPSQQSQPQAFTFGGSSPQPQPQVQPQAFTFGGSPQSQGFSFGSSPQQQSQPQAASGFGSAPQQSQPQAQPQAFTFGGSSPQPQPQVQPQAQPQAFTFGGSAPQQQQPQAFSFGGAPQQPSQGLSLPQSPTPFPPSGTQTHE